MAIKERKQITGTTAQIQAFAGHEGVLAFDKEKKELHVLSGTAGTSTVLAKKSDIPAPVDISGKADKTEVALKADKTYVDQQLATKEAKGTAYTKAESDTKYAPKPVGKYLEYSDFPKSTINNTPVVKVTTATGTIENVPTLEGVASLASASFTPKVGDRGYLAGYETFYNKDISEINSSTNDNFILNIGIHYTVTGESGRVWTKVGRLASGTETLTVGKGWSFVGGTVPKFAANDLLVFFWCNARGYIQHVKAGSV